MLDRQGDCSTSPTRTASPCPPSTSATGRCSRASWTISEQTTLADDRRHPSRRGEPHRSGPDAGDPRSIPHRRACRSRSTGTTAADYDQILTAIQAGFTSVMIDGSLLPFEENIAITAQGGRGRARVGLSVEGELGTIGAGRQPTASPGSKQIIYTDPDDAVTFVEQTGVDSLAVAIGTFHGLFPADLKPELKIDLLKEIKKAGRVPLVLHGGSSNPDDEIAEGVARRHQQDQHLERHQGRLPRQDARGAEGRRSCASPTPSRRRRCWP